MAEQAYKFNLLQFIEKHFLILVGIVVFVIWWTGCGNNSGKGKNTSDTTTTQVLQPIVVNPPYQPNQSGNTVYVPIPQGSQPVIPASTLTELIEQVKQLSKSREDLAKEYYAIRNYNDSITLKDTAGNRVGVVNLKQQVSENILKSTQPSYQLYFPRTTITNTIYPSIRNQVFFGASVESPISGAESVQANLGLLFKNKKENIIQMSVGYDFGTKKPAVELGYYFKLSLKPLIPKL